MRTVTIFAIAWVLFPGSILLIETLEEGRVRRDGIPAYKYSQKARRRWSYLWLGWGVWMFGIAVLLTY